MACNSYPRVGFSLLSLQLWRLELGGPGARPDPSPGHSSMGIPAWHEVGDGWGREGCAGLAGGGLSAVCLLRGPLRPLADEWCRSLRCDTIPPWHSRQRSGPCLPRSRLQAILTHAEMLLTGLPLLVHLLPLGHHLLQFLPDLWGRMEKSSGSGNSPCCLRKCRWVLQRMLGLVTQTRIQVLVLPLVSCVTLGKLLNLSEARVPDLGNRLLPTSKPAHR